MNRRRFLLGTFVLGCATALGIRPKRPDVVYFDGEAAYLKTAPFECKHATFYVSSLDPGKQTVEGDFELVMERCGDRVYFSHV